MIVRKWYPSKGKRHLIFIHPYIKGYRLREDKPLIIKDRIIKKVVR